MMASEPGVHYIPIQHIESGEPLHKASATASASSLLSDDTLFDGCSLHSVSSSDSSTAGSLQDLYHSRFMAGSTPGSRGSTLSRDGSITSLWSRDSPMSSRTNLSNTSSSTSTFTRIVVQRAETPTRSPKPPTPQRVVRTVFRSEESSSSGQESETVSNCSTPTSGYISDVGSQGTITPTPSTSGSAYNFSSSKFKVTNLPEELSHRQKQHVIDVSQQLQQQIAVLKSPRRKPSTSTPASTLDGKLLQLRKELLNLRQLDISLLKQLWSLGDSIKEYKNMLNEQQDNVSFDGSFSDIYGMCGDESVASTGSNVSIPIMYHSPEESDSMRPRLHERHGSTGSNGDEVVLRKGNSKMEISTEWMV